jgi:hypothetical protein
MTIKEEMNFLVSNKTSRLNFLKEDTSQEEHNMEEIGSVKSNLLALCHNSEDIIELIRDIISQGVMVWHRNNLGNFISKLFFHTCLLFTLFNLKLYISSKE